MSGSELQERLLERKQHIPIVFITGHGDIPLAVQAMRRGAVDCIRKPLRDQELIDRINEGLGSSSALKQNEDALAAARSRPYLDSKRKLGI
jgi:FixJ family two-component response regulator